MGRAIGTILVANSCGLGELMLVLMGMAQTGHSIVIGEWLFSGGYVTS